MKQRTPCANSLTAALWRAASAFELAPATQIQAARESEEYGDLA